MNQLKPCPFCGNTEPELTHYEEADWVSHEDVDEEGFFVICSVNNKGAEQLQDGSLKRLTLLICGTNVQEISEMAQSQIFRGPNRKTYRQDNRTQYWLHNTCIVEAYDDGRVKLHSGGWMTATTKMAMNQVSSQFNLGFRIFQCQGVWFVSHMGRDLPFHDGLILSQSEFVNEEKHVCTG